MCIVGPTENTVALFKHFYDRQNLWRRKSLVKSFTLKPTTTLILFYSLLVTNLYTLLQ